MHEFGHSLGLDHGGSNRMNCRPDYLPVINYNLLFGLPRVGGRNILDFLPPHLVLDGSTRATAPLATLVENALDETLAVNAATALNSLVFMDVASNLITIPINQAPNWSGDANLPPAPRFAIDTAILADPATGRPGFGAPSCANSATNSTLLGDDDWSRISLPFRQFGASAPGDRTLPTARWSTSSSPRACRSTRRLP
jgi:hypothetical protein